MVLPSLTYGSVVWGHRNVSALSKADRLNRLAALCMAPMRKSTPTAGLEIILNLPPIRLVVEKEGLRGFCRLKSSFKPSWDGLGNRFNSFFKSWEELARRENLQLRITDDIPAIEFWDRPFSTDFPPHHKDLIKFYVKITKSKDHWVSESVAEAGSQFLPISHNQIAKENSRSQVWLSTVKDLLRKTHNLHEYKECIVHSTGLPNDLGKFKITSRVMAKCMDELKRFNKIHLIKVEKPELEAICERGQAKLLNKTPLCGGIPKRLNATQIEDLTLRRWSSYWKERPDCRQTKFWFGKPDPCKSKGLINLGRKELGRLISFITGHGNLNRHESLIDPNVDPLCRLCMEAEEEPIHLATECPLTIAIRNKFSARRLVGPENNNYAPWDSSWLRLFSLSLGQLLEE